MFKNTKGSSIRVTRPGKFPAVIALSLVFSGVLFAEDAETIAFVEDGVLQNATVVGPGVEQHGDHILIQGTGTGLASNLALMEGDFHIKATLAFEVDGTAAGFVFGFHGNTGSFLGNPTGYFGFDSGSQNLFVEGGFMNAAQGTGPASEGAPASDFIEDGVPFLFEAIREDGILTVLIDEVEVYSQEIGNQAIGHLGIRPWRANMQVFGFSASGNLIGVTLPAKENFGEYSIFVENGTVSDVNLIGDGWEHIDNYIVAQGTGKFLQTTIRLLEGDFHIEAEVAMDALNGTAASFRFGNDDFGFDGGRQVFFQSGPLYGPGVGVGPAAAGFPAGAYIQGGQPFLLEAKRVGNTLTVMIDGVGIYQKEFGSDGIGTLAFRPWRSEMRIYNFRVAGNLEEPASLPIDDHFGQVRYISLLGGLTEGVGYQLGPVGTGTEPFLDDDISIVSMPSNLDGNLGFRTSNAQFYWGMEMPDNEPIVFVEDGEAMFMREVGPAWSQGDGFVFNQGTQRWLRTNALLREGDFHIKATMAINAINGTAATFQMGNAHFGFDSGGQNLFVEGGFFGGVVQLDPAADYIEGGVPFLFEAIREGNIIRFLIDEVQVYQRDIGANQVIGSVGFRPWRSEMRVYDFEVTGNFGWTNHLAFEIDRETSVYIANDPEYEADWLTDRFTKTEMTIETTGGDFDVWERVFDARDFVMLPGNGGDGHNYWVLLSKKPSAITESPINYVRTPGGDDWSLVRNGWRLTTDPESLLHSGRLLTGISNFVPEQGVRIRAEFRVPQLQHGGDNSYGLLVMGDSTLTPNQGIRAEWLPRQADGSSTFRLVNNANRTVLEGENSSVSWGGLAPTRTNDWVTGDDQIDLVWDSRASELASPYFLDDDSKVIVRLPDGLDPGFLLDAIKTENDLSNSSENFVQFTVESGEPGDGNEGVTVFVAWDIRNSGFEPDWLTEGFSKTDHLVQVTGGAQFHRLWAAEYPEGAVVTLPGASYGEGGPFLDGTDNYFVLLGDTRSGLDSIYTMEVEAIREGEEWILSATLTDADGFSETVTASHGPALSGGDVFGVIVQHLDRADTSETPVTPIWDTFSLTMDFVVPPVLSGFDAWAAEYFPNNVNDPQVSGPAAMPSGDGVMNLIKYALGLPPLEPVSSADLPGAGLNEEGQLVFVYWERTDINDVVYIPEVSEDLMEWDTGPDHLVEIFRNPAGGNVEEVGVRPNNLEGANRVFLRLRLEQSD